MIRGYVSGVFWGAIVAGAAIAVVSQVAPLPGGQVAELPAPDDQPQSEPVPEAAPLPTVPDPEVAPEILQKGPVGEEADPEVTSGPSTQEAPQTGPETARVEAEQAELTEAQPQPEMAVPPVDILVDAPRGPEAALVPDDGAPSAETMTEAAPGLAPALEPLVPAGEDLPKSGEAPPAPAVEEALLQPDPMPKTETAPALVVPQEPEMTTPQIAPTLPSDAEIETEVPGVTTDRLPRIGDEPEGEEVAVEDLAVTGTTPLELFARAFDNPEAKPLFSIILIDQGSSAADRENLAALPFPITFALDPLAPDSADAVRVYRAAGQEVAMLVSGVPEGATASDMEQTFQALDMAMPEAVVVLDRAAEGFQDKPDLARQAVPIVAAQGRGVVTYDRGLNTADQIARREGVPAAVIFRVLDSEGESIPKMRNYLDRAAFKAAQEGRVLVIGTTRPETVAAILEWTVEGRASTVALAPVSAVLQADPRP